MTFFPDNDKFWLDAADFLQSNTTYGDRILAPEAFTTIFNKPEVKHPVRQTSYQLLSSFSYDFFDVVVIHKGMSQNLSRQNIQSWLAEYSLVFANDVFLILVHPTMSQTDLQLKILSKEQSHVMSFQALLLEQPYDVKHKELSMLDDRGVAGALNYRPVLDFVSAYCEPGLILMPDNLVPYYSNAQAESSLGSRPIHKVNFALVCISSIENIAYDFIVALVKHCVVLYADNQFVVYARKQLVESGDFVQVIHHQTQTPNLHEALSQAVNEGGLQWSYTLYRYMIQGY